MSVNEMRDRLVRYYPDSKAWAARVSRMPDNQIHAIYMRIFARN